MPVGTLTAAKTLISGGSNTTGGAL